MKNRVYIDVMLDGSFVRQMRYDGNYHLEQIEQLTNNQNWCAFPKQSHKELKELITKLKKK